MKRFYSIIGLFLFVVLSMHAQNDKLFEQANTLYNEGDYLQAIEAYQKIEKSGVHSAALYYNLGNAYYKQNQVANSIYYFEKALLLSPDDQDIRNNLNFARNMTIDAIETIPPSGFAKLVENELGNLSYNTWGKFAIGFIVLFVTAFLLYYFSVQQNRKRAFFAISITALICSLASLGLAYHQFAKAESQKPAIVFSPEVNVKTEPNNRSEASFVLHEGTKVQVLDTMGAWKKIRLADGKIGWLPADDIKEIKDF